MELESSGARSGQCCPEILNVCLFRIAMRTETHQKFGILSSTD
jgi:hypothetical protein